MVNKRVSDFAMKCPRDCPFRMRLASGFTPYFCAFALYADMLDAGRHTRTEIREDGTVDYHIPPDCDVYEKYKGEKDMVEKAKRDYESRNVQLKLDSSRSRDLVVTGHKHPKVQKRHR